MKSRRRLPKLEQLHDLGEKCITDFWWCKMTKGYARRLVRENGKVSGILAHRAVMEAKLGRPLVKGEQVDHINGNKLDNRRCNLRVVTNQQNHQNLHHCGATRGASWVERLGKFRAYCRYGGKQIHLGMHLTVEGAAATSAAKRKELGYFDSTPVT